MYSTAEPTPSRTLRLMDDYVAIARRRRGSLAATALRTRSVDARDLLAHAVGGASTPLIRILAAARDEDHEWLAGLRDEIRSEPLADLARVLACQELRPDDLADGYAIYELMLAVLGDPEPAHQALHVQLAYRLGHRDRVAELLARYPGVPDGVRDALITDLANPYAGGDAAASWAGRFQRLLPDDCLRLGADTDHAPFDLLTVRAAPAGVDGPLVSVLLARGATADTALRSLLVQSWTRLEILLVGASGPVPAGSVPASAVPAGSVQAGPVQAGPVQAGPVQAGPVPASPVPASPVPDDPRIRVLDTDDRNAALAAATGEFVAFADPDTWSHPRRLEHQVAAVRADPDAIASTSAAIEVGDDLTLTRVGAEPAATVSVPSLLFRREAVLGRIGYLDTVTAGAEAEYLARIRAAFGDAAVHHVDEPYALVRRVPSGRADVRPGWAHPARTAYLEAYTGWHDRIRAGTADPYRSPRPTTRPFATPLRLTPGGRTPEYDVILGGEWSSYGGPQQAMIEEIRALTGRGRRVAIMHLDAYRFMSAKPRGICAQIRQLIDDRVADRVLPGDDVATNLLVVRYPPVLQFITDLPSGIRAKQVLILANQAPSERDGSDARYAPRTCADNARRLFGSTALWAPQGPAVRDLVAAELDPAELATFDVPGIIDADAWQVERTWLCGDRPVLGKHTRDNWASWPADRATLLQAFPAALDIDVRLLGGVEGARALLDGERLPSGWRVYEPDEIDAKTFLSRLDFYLHFPHPSSVEAPDRAIVEAMAAGCVVLMPHYLRRTFGDAALYCEPDEVEGVVRHLHGDPETFLGLSRSAQAHVRQAFCHDRYADLVSSLVD